MANPYRDKKGQFASGGSGGGSGKVGKFKRLSMGESTLSMLSIRAPKSDRQAAAKADRAATKNYAKFDKMYLRSGLQTRYGAAIKAAPVKGTLQKPKKTKPKTKTRSFSKAERMRGTDAPRGRRGSKADRMADTW